MGESAVTGEGDRRVTELSKIFETFGQCEPDYEY